MDLTKHHGLGNDFLVTFVDEVPAHASDLAIDLCNRSTGIGADGLIFGIDSGLVPIMALFNNDGSSAEISGNGLRCFVQAVAMRRGVTTLDIEIETAAGRRACELEATNDPAVCFASTDMGEVTVGDSPDSEDFLSTIDGLEGVKQWAIGAVGNPHVVIEVDDPSKIELARVGPQIETHFPHGVNAHFVSPASGADSEPDEIILAVWERGAGITQACGSGATVSAQRMHEWGLVGERVKVTMPGGSAFVDVATAGRASAVLSGEATFVGSVQVPRG